ncbi:MAG: NAD(P)-dependent alcohol dehydrogenase, partial [Gluconacetobacter diazotrophicus]|nr:NAD(P)-dependent alcohol dehydrogenase [Gluconacetobacter diazotrophicus]
VVGMPTAAHSLDINTAMAKELRVEFVFRYANVFPRALAMIASGKVDLKPLISATFPFERSIEAFERAARGEPTDVKLQIAM